MNLLLSPWRSQMVRINGLDRNIPAKDRGAFYTPVQGTWGHQQLWRLRGRGVAYILDGKVRQRVRRVLNFPAPCVCFVSSPVVSSGSPMNIDCRIGSSSSVLCLCQWLVALHGLRTLLFEEFFPQTRIKDAIHVQSMSTMVLCSDNWASDSKCNFYTKFALRWKFCKHRNHRNKLSMGMIKSNIHT